MKNSYTSNLDLNNGEWDLRLVHILRFADKVSYFVLAKYAFRVISNGPSSLLYSFFYTSLL